MTTTSSTTTLGPLAMTSSLVIDYVSVGDEEGSCHMMLLSSSKSLSIRIAEVEKHEKKQGLAACSEEANPSRVTRSLNRMLI